MSLVHYHNKRNNTTYVYESLGYWDKEKQQARNKRTCIGKLDPDTGEIIYNRRYRERNESVAKPGPVPTEVSSRIFYGASFLLDSISNKLGIEKDLKACFPNDYKKILSLAYFMVLEGANPMYRFSHWAKSHYHPNGKDIPSQRISEIFERIDENSKFAFFKKQADRISDKDYLFYDTTSISSYSQSIKQVKYGKNKEGDKLPQINLSLLLSESSSLPVYYRKNAGNITDVTLIPNLAKELDFLEINKVQLVLDRGFYSETNINELYHKHHKFIIGAKTSIRFIQQKLDTLRKGFVSRVHYDSKTGLYIQSFSTNWSYTETKARTGEIVKSKKRIYVHFYYNDQHATDDKIRLNKKLDAYEQDIISGAYKKDRKKYEKYYAITETPVRGVKYEPKQEAIDKSLKNSGYFVLLSNGVKDPSKALEIYRNKDLIEKRFENLKERLNMRREYVETEENLEGKLFVQYVALIFVSYINKAMNEGNLYKNYTMQGLLDELDVIERFHHPSKSPYFGEVTNKQKSFYKAMKVDSPT